MRWRRFDNFDASAEQETFRPTNLNFRFLAVSVIEPLSYLFSGFVPPGFTVSPVRLPDAAARRICRTLSYAGFGRPALSNNSASSWPGKNSGIHE